VSAWAPMCEVLASALNSVRVVEFEPSWARRRRDMGDWRVEVLLWPRPVLRTMNDCAVASRSRASRGSRESMVLVGLISRCWSYTCWKA